MVASANRVPRTYRKPAFIPDGYVDVLGALSIVGKALFGDKWTGEEIAARSPAQRQAEAEEQHRREDEARQRRDQAAQWLQQRAFARKGSSKVITKGGTVHDLPERVWGDENAWQIFDRGTAGFAELAGYDVVTFEGHVLFRERELRSALPTSTTTTNEERRCREWLADKMRNSRPEKTKAKYQAEAKGLFKISSKAFLRSWADAIADTGKTEWSKPGPKSLPPDQNPN